MHQNWYIKRAEKSAFHAWIVKVGDELVAHYQDVLERKFFFENAVINVLGSKEDYETMLTTENKTHKKFATDVMQYITSAMSGKGIKERDIVSEKAYRNYFTNFPNFVV